jgi:hypothetical protein
VKPARAGAVCVDVTGCVGTAGVPTTSVPVPSGSTQFTSRREQKSGITVRSLGSAASAAPIASTGNINMMAKGRIARM